MTKLTVQNIGVAIFIAIGVFVVLNFLLGFPGAVLGSVILAVALGAKAIRRPHEAQTEYDA
jgi:putative effector of murein hydrolase LrgA (UPF0299 family)